MTGLYRKILSATAAALVAGGAAPVRAEGPGTGEVTAVSLAPSAGKAELVIAVKGAVDVRVEERADVAILAEIRTRGATAFEAEERLDDVRIVVEEREGALHVEATFPEGEVRGDACSFRIRAPRSSR